MNESCLDGNTAIMAASMATASAYTEPIFPGNADRALKWAYGVAAQAIVDGPNVYFRKAPRDYQPNAALEDLDAHERHAQAAQIIQHVESLKNPLQRDVMLVCYAAGHERTEAAKRLSVWLIAQEASGMHNRRAWIEMAYYYGLKQRKDRRVADLLDLSYWKARKVRQRVWDRLGEIQSQAFAIVEERLRDAGVV